MNPTVLDPCCGSRMMWFDKQDQRVLFGDQRTVSTHSRPKAAGCSCEPAIRRVRVSTHSRPKAAGIDQIISTTPDQVSTHSRPKAAGEMRKFRANNHVVSTHSRPKAAGPWPATR